MLVTVIVLINLLIAMMSDTYQNIQSQSDIEWKYGLSKLIRNMQKYVFFSMIDYQLIDDKFKRFIVLYFL